MLKILKRIEQTYIHLCWINFNPIFMFFKAINNDLITLEGHEVFLDLLYHFDIEIKTVYLLSYPSEVLNTLTRMVLPGKLDTLGVITPFYLISGIVKYD